MAQTMSYGIREIMENPASSMFDYIVSPNDPEPGPDGRFHWASYADSWDPLRRRFRGRYRELEPIRSLPPPGDYNPFNYVRVPSVDGEFVKIWIKKGASQGGELAKIAGGAMARGGGAIARGSGEIAMRAGTSLWKEGSAAGSEIARRAGRSIYEAVRPATEEERQIALEVKAREEEYRQWERQQRELEREERRRRNEAKSALAMMNRQAEARTKAIKSAEYEAEQRRQNELLAAREKVEQRFPTRREALTRSMSTRKPETTYAPVREGEGLNASKLSRAAGSVGRFLTGR